MKPRFSRVAPASRTSTTAATTSTKWTKKCSASFRCSKPFEVLSDCWLGCQLMVFTSLMRLAQLLIIDLFKVNAEVVGRAIIASAEKSNLSIQEIELAARLLRTLSIESAHPTERRHAIETRERALNGR